MDGFISYAHADYRLVGRFRTHLKAVERSLGIAFWADERVDPGDRWSDEIERAIENASVHLLLVSPDFLGSDYILDVELPAIVGRIPDADVLIIPVILQDCLWQNFVGAVQAVPRDETGALKPIRSWRSHEQGFNRANEQISSVIQKRFGIQPKPLF